jgi:hypothetical protein
LSLSTSGTRVPVPPLDDDARRRALDLAVRSRKVRAEWKRRLGTGEVDVAMLLEAAESEPALAGLRVSDALGALPGIGPKGVERIMRSCGIATSRRLRGLGTRQREALLAGTWRRGGRT